VQIAPAQEILPLPILVLVAPPVESDTATVTPVPAQTGIREAVHAPPFKQISPTTCALMR
jgi:hypothetical protein